ncbi:MAG TPA: siderophore-interacting protein, partial [Polyangiaceae bacterium]|nr:siderophore-interacting protein [Polyangiaceae bacterium]
MPAFLANVLEPKFARPATVAAVIDLAPRLRKVIFEGRALRGAPFDPGCEVEFRVYDRAFRHYTASGFDTIRGAFDVVFFLHGRGPGSAWAEGLREGQRVNVLGPGGGLSLRPGCADNVLLGDETTIGLFTCLEATARCRGAIEVSGEGLDWPARAGSRLAAVERT